MRRLATWLGGDIGRGGLQTYRARLALQIGFALTILLIGIQFGRFVNAAMDRSHDYAVAAAGGASTMELAAEFDLPTRPPGVEGFLPISGLMGALDWIHQDRLNGVHPAATILFLLFLAIALLLRKGFCSWICPVGLISETLARLGRRLPFMKGRNYRLPGWLDVGLRSLKYLLLGFFLWAIAGMSAEALRSFITDDYNIVSDVKMLWFFTDMSVTTAVVLLLLAVASVFVHGFWCRYLCPYGALLGLVSWASPLRIKRNAAACTDCGLCDRVCMARLPVSKKARIISPECTGCLDCVASCPTTNALGVADRRQTVGPLRFGALLLVIFLTGVMSARMAGLWENRVSDLEYLRRVPNAHFYDHPR